MGRWNLTAKQQQSYQIKEIAELKMEDLNASSLESAMSMIEGTARRMGLNVER